MPATSNSVFLIKTLRVGNSPLNGIWTHYDDTLGYVSASRFNPDPAYLGSFLESPMNPSEIFVRQTYTSLSFCTDFILGSNTTVNSQRRGVLPVSLSVNKIYVSYKPSHLTDVFTFRIYSSDNSSSSKLTVDITISPVDVAPTVLQGNPTINTLNNKYTGLTMLFSEGGVDAGTLTTSSYESSVSNVSFSNGACTFDYTTPTTQTSDSLIFTSFRAADIQVVNTSQYLFQITNLLEQPHFSSWIYSPGSQSFSYTGIDSLIAVFNKDISTCTSITASSGTPTTIIPTSIIGKQVKFEWTSLTTGNVTFTFNGLTSTDGTIDASVDGLTVAGPIILNTPPTIVGWNVTQPTEANTLYNLSVVFNKQLSNSRIPIITATDSIVPVFTSVSGSQVNFTVTTSSTPSTTIYSLKNVSGLDGSIRSENASISAGAKINSIDVETDLAGSFLTMANLVILRTQKVKIILSKAISGTLSLVPNANCTFGAVTMINSSTAQFTITPADNGVSSLTIQTSNLITQDGGGQSTISYTFNLIYSQTFVNLFESLNKNMIKTTFDVGTMVALSVEVSKPIPSDLSGTTISCSNGTISNLSSSTILGKYYYDFNFTPTAETTNQIINVNNAKDLSNFKYTLSSGSLTFIIPYFFPTSFNFLATNNNRYYRSGYLSQGLSGSLILTFTGGDNLHSNVVETQISYVKYVQNDIETVILPTNLSCSSALNTITINSITPSSLSELIVKVQLKSPKGAVSPEMTSTITSSNFATSITAVNLTSPYVPSPYKLVANSSVNLSFNFNTTTPFTSEIVSSVSATVNGNALSLASATTSGVSLVVPYTAVSAIQHNFVIFAFNQQFNFLIQASEVYTYKDIINTARNIPTVTIGQSLTLKSNFISTFPASMTGTVIVTPNGYSPVTHQATLTAGTLLDFASPTWYYPFTSNVQNYASGLGVTDATIGVGGNAIGGTATFSDGLVLTGSSTHNGAGASYVVLPTSSSGNIAAFSCWFKSNNNANYTRIIDMATNGTFKLYVTGSNSLNFNDVYTFNTATPINNNTWNFIAINTTATTLSWVLNAGDTGNYGYGSINSNPVNFNLSVGYLGHSFGGDPEFAGSLKEVSFYSNANLTTQQISGLYMGTTRVSIDHTVAYDVVHSGSIQLFYGNTNKIYTWASDTLTSSNIYTFPSSFTYDGTSNGYPDGAHLKDRTQGTLKLTFAGGDMLFSSSVSTQISYVKYLQDGTLTQIPSSALTCSDPLETITIGAITPTKTDLVLKVQLKGPDGVLSPELTTLLPATQIASTWFAPSGVTALLSLNGAVSGSDYDFKGFAAFKTYTSVVLALQWANLTNAVNIAATGAVRVYVATSLVASVVPLYTYRQETNDILVTSMTLGTQVGAIEFGVTITSPSGVTFELRTSGHTVYAVPDTVVVSSLGDGYSFVADNAVVSQFTFSHSNSTVNSAISMTGTRSTVLSLTSSATVDLATTFVSSKVLSATVTASSAQQNFTFTFASTRTTVSMTVLPSAIYTMPATATLTIPSTVITIGNSATITWNLSNALPVTATHSTTGSGVTYARTTASPVSVRTTNLVYTITPTIKQNHPTCTLTLTFGGITTTYTQAPFDPSKVYSMPTGISAVVSFTGSVGALDSSITTLALGASYGSTAGSAICGNGNTSSILLTLTGYDTTTANPNEIVSIQCVDSTSLVVYGNNPTFTYDASTHSASINTYTLPSTAPASGSIKFAVTVTSPDGYTTTLRTIPIPTAADATSATLGILATGLTFVSGSSVTVPVSFSNSAGSVNPTSVELTTTGSFSALSAVSSGAFSATYFGVATATTLTFIVSPTRRRIAVTVPTTAILVWPTSATTAPVSTVTVGTASAIVTTLSSTVPAPVTVALSGLGASDLSSGASLSTPAVSGAAVTYNLTATSNATYTAIVTLSVAGYSTTLTQTIATADQIYAWPTSLEAILALNGATSGSDYNVLGFAAGKTYSTGSTLTLNLKGIDLSPTNSAEVAAGAVRVYVAGSLVVGAVASYTYSSLNHNVVVTSMTLGTQTGDLQFGVTVTAPSGATYELRTSGQGHIVYAVPDTVVISSIGGGYSLIANTPISSNFTFSNSISTINAALGTMSASSSSNILALTSSATVNVAATFGSNKVLTVTVTPSAAQQTFTFTFNSTRTTAVVTVLATAIYSFPMNVTFSQPALAIGVATSVTATVNSVFAAGMTYAITAATGTIASGSGTATAVTQLNFTYTASTKSDVTGTLTLTWQSITRTLTNVLATATGTYSIPTTLTYDGASLNPTFYSRHFKSGTLASVELTVNGDLLLGTPQAIANAVSSVTYTQSGVSGSVTTIYAIDSNGSKTSGYSSDPFASSLLVAIPCDAIADVSNLINTTTNAKTITVNPAGGTVTQTSVWKYYGRSIRIGNPSGSFLVSGFSSSIYNGDFTFECWFNTFDTSVWTSLLATRPYGNALVCGIEWSGGLGRAAVSTWGTNAGYSTYYITPNVWHHCAVTRTGTTYVMYIDGTSVATMTGTSPTTTGTSLLIGAYYSPEFGDSGVPSNNEARAFLNDVRVYTTRKYTANFTAAAPTSTTTTASLVGATFTNSSFTLQMTPTMYAPMTITAVLNKPSGTTTLTSSVPLSDFYTYIYPTSIVSVSPTVEIYTSDSTMMTLNLTPVDGAPNATAVIYQASTSSSSTPTQVSTSAGTANASGILTGSCTFPTAGTWYVYALMSSPSSVAASTKIVCLTPITVAAYVMPTTMTYDGATLNQATFGTGFGFKQNVSSDVVLTFSRLYLGNPALITNAYSSITYTQPSSAANPPIYVTTSTGAKLNGITPDTFASWLVLAIPGDTVTDISGTINSASTTKVVSTISTAATSTTQSKFYGTSLYVPGYSGGNRGFKVTGMPSGFLFGDWTVEGWFYLTAWTSALFKLGAALVNANTGNVTTNPTIRLVPESAATTYLEISGGAQYQATFSAFTLNTWTHVAVVRRASPGNKGAFSVYVNGTLQTLTVNANNGTQPAADPGTTVYLGCPDDLNLNATNLNGYIQDFRMYVAAKYTANFTVTPLPVAKTPTLVSSTSTTMRLTITPDYYDSIAFSVGLKGPSSTTGTATVTTNLTDMVPASVQATTVSARYVRMTLYYAGGTGASGPVFPKLGIYTLAADAYSDTGISSANLARSATFTAVSGDASSGTTTTMIACINDTRTSWAASTTGTLFGTTKTTGPAYYTIDLGSTQTIGAVKIAAVTYESTGYQWFSAKLEVSSDNSTWTMTHLINARNNETQSYVHSGYTLNGTVGESLVLAVVSRQYKPTSYVMPSTLGTVTASLTEGTAGTLSVVATTTQGATAIVAHALTSNVSDLWTSAPVVPSIVTSGIALLLDAGKTTSYPGSGTTWTDLSGNGYTGTLTNGPTYSSGSGGYISFDGVNDFVTGSIASSAFSGAHTISCWFYRTSNASVWSDVFSLNAGGISGASGLGFLGSANKFGVNQIGVNQTSAVSVDLGADHINQWIYATVVYAGSTNGSALTVYAYKNGTLITGTGSLYWNLTASSTYLIGVDWYPSGPSYFSGYIPHVAVYNRALSASEIDQNYNSLKSRYGASAATGTSIIGSGTFDSTVLTTTVTPSLTGQVYFYIKTSAPGGGATASSYLVVGPVTVASYSLPTSISAATTGSLVVGVGISGQTLTLSGPNTANLTSANISIYLNTSSTVLSNCTVTGYNSSSGLVTFTATPSASGMNTLYAKVTAPVGVTNTTLSYLGASGQGFFVETAPIQPITSSAGSISSRSLNGSTYTCIRMSGTLTVPSAITGAEILMIAGGGGGSFSAGAGGGAGGAAYFSGASIPAGTYAVTVGAGGAGSAGDGGNGTVGQNSVAFGVTVYGGGGGSHNSTGNAGGCGSGGGYAQNTVGGSVTLATGSVTGITATLATYGNAGGGNPTANSYIGGVGAGGGIGGVGGAAQNTPAGGIGGIGKSTWSDWCAACGVGEGDTSGIFWIGGGGGGTCNETSSTRRAGEGGKGGGGRGGFATAMTTLGTEGLATAGLDYSGGGGGGGHITLPSSLSGGYVPPGGSGGSGVIIIKQTSGAGVSGVTSPAEIAGLQLWLDGSDPSNGTVPANGATVATWIDKSGNSRSAVPVGANKAVYKGAATVGGINTTLGTMYFNNTPYKIPYTSFSPTTYTIFTVFRAERGLTSAGLSMTPVVSNNSCYVLTGTSDCQLYFGMWQDKFSTAIGNSGTWYGGVSNLPGINTPSTSVRGQWVLATMQYSSSTKTTTTFLNGIAMTNKGPDATAQNGGVAWNDLYIGQANSAGSDYRLQGYIGEIIIYNSVLASSDRQRVEAYLSLKYGFGADSSGSSGAYTMPTSISAPSTSYLTANMTITATGASSSAAPITVYYAATTGITSVSGLTQSGTGTLTSGSASVTSTIPVGTWYVYVRVTSPGGALGPVLCAPMTTTVAAYSLPTSISTATINAVTVGVAATSQTLTLNGPNIESLVAANITVYLNTSSTQVSNCSVTVYNSVSGVVTFTATPSVSGMNTLYAKVTAPIAGSTQSSTLSFLGTTNQGYYFDSAGYTTNIASTTCGLWLDCADPAGTGIAPANNATVSTIVDKSGNTLNAVANISNPTFAAGSRNGLGTLLFNSCRLVSQRSFATGGPYTMFVVMDATSATPAYLLAGPGNDLFVGPYNGSFGTFAGSNGWVNPIAANTPAFTTTNTWMIGTIVMSTAASVTTLTPYTNGTAQNAISAATFGRSVTSLAIGAMGFGSQEFFAGYLAELIVYNRVLSTSERQGVESYLGAKWGITVANAIAQSYTMPTSFTYSPITGYVDGIAATMTITTTGASTSAAPVTVFYGSTAGITSTSGLTQCGTGTLTSNSASISVTIPTGTWYIYIRVTSPSGALGPLIGAVATLTSRSYIHATSIVSFTPDVLVQSATTTLSVTMGGYDTAIAGTASVYYAATSSDTNPTLIGTTAPVSGVVTVTGTIPLSTYYIYARTISPSAVQGALLVSALVTPRAYSFPTSISFTSLRISSPTVLTFSPADTIASASVTVYYHSTSSSTTPTQCGTGTVDKSGSASVICTFPTSAVYVYAIVTAPNGTAGSLLHSASSGTAIPILITSGLVIDIEIPPSYTSASTLANSATASGVATMHGTYSLVTVSGKRAIHVVNTDINAGPNISGIWLPSANFRTISIWFYFTILTPTITNANRTGYFMDGRSSNAAGAYISTAPVNQSYLNPPAGQYGTSWSYFYLNGGASRPITDFMSLVYVASTSWQHVTIVSTESLTCPYFNLFGDYRPLVGIDINMGRVSVYSTILSQADNAQNYTAGF